MKTRKPALKKKCHTCKVALRRGGCLFGCTRKEKLAREFQLVIEQANSAINPLTEQLRQCPEAFETGRLLGELFAVAKNGTGARILPPPGTVLSPLV